MTQEQRQHRRIEKRLTILFCLKDDSPKKWDMSLIENISIGGVKFAVPHDLQLKDKIIHLQIKIPELAPHCLQLDALVLSATPRSNGKISDIRAKFINVSQADKELLSVVEKMIDLLEKKNAGKKIN